MVLCLPMDGGFSTVFHALAAEQAGGLQFAPPPWFSQVTRRAVSDLLNGVTTVVVPHLERGYGICDPKLGLSDDAWRTLHHQRQTFLAALIEDVGDDPARRADLDAASQRGPATLKEVAARRHPSLSQAVDRVHRIRLVTAMDLAAVDRALGPVRADVLAFLLVVTPAFASARDAGVDIDLLELSLVASSSPFSAEREIEFATAIESAALRHQEAVAEVVTSLLEGFGRFTDPTRASAPVLAGPFVISPADSPRS